MDLQFFEIKANTKTPHLHLVQQQLITEFKKFRYHTIISKMCIQTQQEEHQKDN